MHFLLITSITLSFLLTVIIILYQNFRKSLQDHWDKSAKLYHISMKKVSFKRSGSDARAALEFPQYVNGWNVVPDSTPCFVSQVNVLFLLFF